MLKDFFTKKQKRLISKRTRKALSKLKHLGVKLGPPQKIQYEKVKKYRLNGFSLSKIGKKFNVDPSTVSKCLKSGDKLLKTRRK